MKTILHDERDSRANWIEPRKLVLYRDANEIKSANVPFLSNSLERIGRTLLAQSRRELNSEWNW